MASYLWDVDLDMQRNQVINLRLENRTTAPADHAEGMIYYDSLVDQKRIKLCVDDTTPTYVSLPRLDLDETVAGVWNFSPGVGAVPFTVPGTHAGKVTNLNADLLEGYHGNSAVVPDTFALRQSDGTIRASDPVNADELATKAYVDATRQDMDTKDEVWAATTVNVTLSSMPAAIDGRTMSNGDRFLARAQTDASENGIYIYNGSGSAATRAPDADESSEVTAGMTVFVVSGTNHQGAVFTLTTPNPITLDDTDLTFTQTGGQSIFDAGNGMIKVGNKFHFVTDSNYAVGSIPYAATATTMGFLGAGNTGTVLKGQGAGNAPVFGAVSLSADVSGVLPAGNGGTGTSTTFTAGSVIFMGGSNAYAQDASNFKWDDANNRLAINWSGTPYAGVHAQSQGILATRGGGLTALSDVTGFDGLMGAILGDDSTVGGGLFLVKNAGNRGARGHANGSPLVDFSFSDEVAFHINKDGNIGIWTDTPAAVPLHIQTSSGTAVTGTTYEGVTNLILEGGTPHLQFRGVDAFWNGVYWAGNGEGNHGQFEYLANGTSGQYRWMVNDATEMSLDPGGFLGLGESAGSASRLLDVVLSDNGEYAQMGKTGDVLAFGANAYGNYIEMRASSRFRIYSGSDHEDYWEIDNEGTLRLSDRNIFYWMDDDNSHGVGFRAASNLTGNTVWTLPAEDAVFADSALVSNAAGALSWKEILTQDSAVQASMRQTGGFYRLFGDDEYFSAVDNALFTFGGTGVMDRSFAVGAFVKLFGIGGGGILTKAGTGLSDREWEFFVNSSGNLYFALYDGAADNVYVETDADLSAYVGQWVHVMAVCDAVSSVGDRENDLKLYINGELVAQTAGENGAGYGGMVDTTVGLQVGLRGSSEYHEMAISHAYVYNKALSSDEVNALVKDSQPVSDHRWGGDYGGLLNQSAWTSHGWTNLATPTTVSGGGDHDGQTDVLHVVGDGSSDGVARSAILPEGCYVEVEARVKVISGTVVFRTDNASHVFFEATTANAGAWTTLRGVAYSPGGDLNALLSTASGEWYTDEVKVTKVGCVAWWSQSTAQPTVWRDNSENGLHLTASGSPGYVGNWTHMRIDQPVAGTTDHAFEIANAGTVKFAVDGRGRGIIGGNATNAIWGVKGVLDTAYNNQAPSISNSVLSLTNNPTSELTNAHATIQFGINGGTYNRVGSISMLAVSDSNRDTALAFCLDDGGSRSEKMRLTNDGLGIKTNDPKAILHVYGGNSIASPDASAGQFLIEGNATCGMTIASGPTANGEIFFADSFSTTIGRLRYHHADDSMSFWTNDSEHMRILSAGYVQGHVGFESDVFRGKSFTTSFLSFNDDQTLSSDMTTLAAQGRLNFIIDTANNSTTKWFRWWTDSSDVDSATQLMELTEAGVLTVLDRVRCDLFESDTYQGTSYLHFNDSYQAGTGMLTLASVASVQVILDSNGNSTDATFQVVKNDVQPSHAEVFSITEEGEAKLTLDAATSKTGFWIDQTVASNSDTLLKITAASAENGSRAISYEADQAEEKFIVWGDGTVSIGSDTPIGEGTRLHVFRPTGASTFTLGSGDGSGVVLVLDGNANGDGAGGDYASITHNSDGEVEFTNNQAQPIDFRINGGNCVRFTENKTVSIGRHGGTWPLDVYSSTNAQMLRIVHENTGNQGPVFRLEHDSSSQAAGDSIGEIEFVGRNSADTEEEVAHIRVTAQEVAAGYVDADFIHRVFRGGTAYDVFSVTHDRRIGVNQTSPSTVFELVNPELGETAPFMISATSTGDASIRFNISGASDWCLGADNSDADKFKLSPGSVLSVAAVMTWTSTGVGIFQETPAYELDVTGDIHATGSLFTDSLGLLGYYYHSYTNSTTGSGVGNGFSLTVNANHSSTLNNLWHYTVMLTTTGTGTSTGARYVVYYDGTNWQSHLVSRAGSTGNHPLLDVTTAGVGTVYTNDATAYTIQVTVESYLVNDDNGATHSLGAEYMWSRDQDLLTFVAESKKPEIRLLAPTNFNAELSLWCDEGGDAVDRWSLLARAAGTRRFAIAEDGTDRLVVEAGGNVGVNSENPIARLQVVEPGAGLTAFRVEGASNGFALLVRGGTNYSTAMRGPVTIGNSYASVTGPTGGLLVEGKVGVGVTTVESIFGLQIAGAIGLTDGGYSRYAMRHTSFGFDAAYRALIIGSASTSHNTSPGGSITPFFCYDPNINSNSSFHGTGKEVGFRNEVNFITPNATDDGWLFPFTMKDGKCGIANTDPIAALDIKGVDDLGSTLRLSNTAPTPDNEWRLTADSSFQNLNITANDAGVDVMTLADSGAVMLGSGVAGTWGLTVNNSTAWSATGTCLISAQLDGSGKGLQVNCLNRTTSDNAVAAFEVIDRANIAAFQVRVDGGVRLTNLTASKVVGLDTDKQLTTSVTTDFLPVGTTNLYFTNSLARAALTTNDTAEIAYNNVTGVIGLGTEACRIKTGTIGDGTSTSIPFTHDLGTKGVLVQVIENSGAGREIRVQPERTDVNFITLKFNEAPATDEFLVIVAAPNG